MVLHSLYSRKADEWQKTDIERINYLDEEEPTHCQNKGGHYKMLPLHYAIMNKAPLVVVQRIYNINKDAIKDVHLDGWTPLHMAAYYNRKEYIPWLKKVYPEAAMEKDKDDRTPLDVAANYKRVDALALLSQPAKKKVLGFDDEEKKDTAENKNLKKEEEADILKKKETVVDMKTDGDEVKTKE